MHHYDGILCLVVSLVLPQKSVTVVMECEMVSLPLPLLVTMYMRVPIILVCTNFAIVDSYEVPSVGWSVNVWR